MEAPLEETCSQAEPGSAICVQRFDDSLNSAIRTTYRISLRSSSLREPRYPSTRVVCCSTRAGAHTKARAEATPTTRSRWGGAHTRALEYTNALTRRRLPKQCLRGSATPQRPRERAHHRTTPRRGPTRGPGTTTVRKVRVERPVMILPQVHLRKPCYDFSFL